jgi:hypothetical protein
MRLTLDSESLYKWLVKHRFDLCLGVSIIWITLVIVVLWPTSADYDWRLILKNTGKALAPLGIVVTLFLNFTTAVKNAEKDQTGDKDAKLLKYKQVENAMLIIAKYDDDDYLAAKHWLRYCIRQNWSSDQVSIELGKLETILNNVIESNEAIAVNLDGLQSNIVVSMGRFLNYLDEVRLSTMGPEPYADKHLVYETLSVAIVTIYGILQDFIKREQSINVTRVYDGKSWYLADHNDLKKDMIKFIEAYRD